MRIVVVTIPPQQKTYQSLLLALSLLFGLGAAVPAYLGILFWEKYQEGTFPPLSVILHRGDVARVLVMYDDRTVEVADPRLLSRFYRSFMTAGQPVRYQVPAMRSLPGPRSVRFFRKDGSMLPIEMGRFEGGALFCPTLDRTYLDDAGGLCQLAREIRSSSKKR